MQHSIRTLALALALFAAALSPAVAEPVVGFAGLVLDGYGLNWTEGQ